jgi:hypothetical protein
MTILTAIHGLDPACYTRSPLHGDHLIWPEKNCYVDIWIEVLNALQLETRAILPFVFALDFEGDQWTFFKPPHGELYDLYGLDVQELTVWKPLLEHVVEHVPAGRLISTEADAFWLPDTSGTDYRRNHVKSTIVINAIDAAVQTLDYFHNAAYHRLSGEDFRALFRMDIPPDPAYLPLFAEYIRIERCRRETSARLAIESRQLLVRHIARRPRQNPLERFAARFEAELPQLQDKGLDYYHLWAFGSLRQLGAAFELAAINLRWLQEQQVLVAKAAAEDFELISSTCKSLVLKGARAVNARRTLDIQTPCAVMAEAWNRGMVTLEQSLRA